MGQKRSLPPLMALDCEPCEADVPFRQFAEWAWRMRAFHGTMAALAAILGFVALFLWLDHDRGQLSGPVLIMPQTVSTTLQLDPGASNFRVPDRVLHSQFGHGTVVAAEGRILTINFDNGGMKRVLESFVVRSDEPHQ
ncbi:hypothetical protein [Bradyrhizobium sp. HKCCYLS20291]|uniref:hypothetical protein n=1 Tax=Bradyrhizobium sp. HKCCYLS20291 TaxID=3420766 RepID=UPI003EC09EC0